MSATASSAPGRLASALQEAITAVLRVRANRQPVTDAVAFRAQMLQLLARAEQDALALGFSTQDTRLAIFAVVAFLDESVLNTGSPALADWARRPVQDELFGGHMGGEWFFQHIEQLLTRPDSQQLADLLEVYQLCLLLGFRGRYGAGDHGALHAITARVSDRLSRLRGPVGDLAPAWQPPADRVESRDPWLRRLTVGAITSVVLLLALWGGYFYLLRGDTRALASLAAPSLAATSVPAPTAR